LALFGHSPLRGREDSELGPRFVSMVDAYDAELRTMVLDAAAKGGIAIVEGVYVMVGGPNYETPAEARFLRQLGDAVGMSTASEVIAARQLGLRVMAISGITNAVAMQPDQPGADHEEVLASGALLAPRLSALLQVLVPELCTVL
jgi:purine-nucleoside phosphorylase